MMASLFSGVSGLTNNLTKMNVIGNNIANVNTIGFKTGRVTFREALVQTYKSAGRPSSITGGTNPIQLGLGMQVSTIDNLFQQGGLETTGQITDLAIQGQGFFILSDDAGARYYTRAGSFGFDANSTLVDPSTGMFVQGKLADSAGNIPSTAVVDNIVMPFGQQDPAVATSMIVLSNNLNSVATDSEATLVSAGDSGISFVSGYAIDGAGGTHVLTITGDQATQSSFTGSNVADDGTGNPGVTLAGNMSLGSLGVTDASAFSLSVDNGSIIDTVNGLTVNSTVNDLITQINQIHGITAELIGGQIRVSRDRAGSGIDYNITSSVSSVTLDGNGVATAGNIIGVIFGVPDSGTFLANNGTNHTFNVNNVFTPTGASALPAKALDVIVDETTGLATGIKGLGGGGVTISTLNGLSSGPSGTAIVNITTKDTTHATSITVYDSQGGKHSMTVEFRKTLDPNRWDWTATLGGNELITGGGSGEVRFNSDGSMLSFTYDGGASSLTFNPNNGAANVSIGIDAGTVGDFNGLTGFASSHTANIINQNGHSVGILDKLSIDKAGNMIGIFTNGVSRVLAQIILADFNNQAGLLKAGQSLYQASANSGDAITGVAGETISANISSGALEASSVDIASEFTSMITAQRGFQANARIITTSDDMLDELVNLKR